MQKRDELRFARNELIGGIAKRFITGGGADGSIDAAFAAVGEFMDIAKISISGINEKTDTLRREYEWVSEKNTISRAHAKTFAFTEGPALREAFGEKNLTYIAHPNGQSDYVFDSDLFSFIAFPVHLSGALWGVMSFDANNAERTWSEDDMELASMLTDIVSAVMQREKSEEAKSRMASIVSASPTLIAHLTHDGTIRYANRAAAEISGFPVEELFGANISIMLDELTGEQFKSEVLPKTMKNGTYEIELPMQKKDGEKRMVEFTTFTLGLRDAGIGLTAVDVTERRAIERVARSAQGDSEGATAIKGEFLSRMSHEMRTPMNAVIGMTNIAKASTDPEKIEYCLDKIETAAKHLLGIINDVLDMSKIEANKFDLTYGEFEFEKMITRVVGTLKYSMDEKHQQFYLRLDRSMPPVVISDDQRLAQVISNLLTNAIKFTPERGTISLSTHLLEIKGEEYTFELSITDTGIGISEDQQRKLFLSFEQADTGISRKYDGAGLGLAITKKIVDLMGGEIRVTSKVKQGSTFTVRLTVKRGATRVRTALSEGVSWETVRILAVDDSPEVREFFLGIADSLHLHCDVAENAEEALSMIGRVEEPYNLIFVDWKMPGMDGIEMTRAIRAMNLDNTVVIMISSAEWSEIETKARQAGVDRFIPKPLFASMLTDSINEYLGIEAVATSIDRPADRSKKRNYSGKTILLAEDIEINRDIAIALLEDTNIRIISASNGQEALRMFEQTPDGYDLILMDVHMPVMDGMEATEAIRALPLEQAQNIPIIAITANVFKEDIDACLAAGMNSHIAKPIDKDELLKVLDKHLTVQVASAPRSTFKEVKLEPQADAKQAASDYAQYKPFIHVEGALQKLANNKMLYFTLLNNFQGQTMVDELKRVIVRNDSAKMAQAAQALAGSAGNLGLDRLAEVAQAIDKRARTRISADDLLTGLDEAINATTEAISKLMQAEGVQ